MSTKTLVVVLSSKSRQISGHGVLKHREVWTKKNQDSTSVCTEGNNKSNPFQGDSSCQGILNSGT